MKPVDKAAMTHLLDLIDTLTAERDAAELEASSNASHAEHMSQMVDELTAERDAARADAARLAEALEGWEGPNGEDHEEGQPFRLVDFGGGVWADGTPAMVTICRACAAYWPCDYTTALAAHDAEVAGHG